MPLVIADLERADFEKANAERDLLVLEPDLDEFSALGRMKLDVGDSVVRKKRSIINLSNASR